MFLMLTLMKTMRRLREMSHFECHVRVLRNGFCKSFFNISVTSFRQQFLQ